jgi:hypothetical protein
MVTVLPASVAPLLALVAIEIGDVEKIDAEGLV